MTGGDAACSVGLEIEVIGNVIFVTAQVGIMLEQSRLYGAYDSAFCFSLIE
jgi:hypothetical protein